MKSKNLKKKYIEFFINNGHKEIVDSPLIPYNDPTVLFTTAGMHPLVPFLLGQPNPSGKKLVNIQKCLRTGDIEEVGDEFHLTFFNMLGNWSFGDYWKKEAIEMSFEFLTSKKYLGFPIEKLGVSVFGGDKDAPADEESEKIWESLGISSERIARLGKKDNWWGPAGKTGPCGPDSEMFYWSSPEDVPEKFDPSNSGWVEIWNDVFMEYDKDSSGKYKPLKQKNVDTGMGYERVFSILEGVENIYESSLFTPIIEKILELSSSEDEKSLRIIADHLRSATFLLAEKIAPSNIEQGYVLRKLIRLAIRRGKLLGIEGRFVSKIAKTIIDNYSEEYSHLKKNSLFIITEIDKEERKFERTLKKGMSVFGKISGEKVSGTEAFLLFQSYGFPIEMTQELASEKGMKVDLKGYKSEFISF